MIPKSAGLPSLSKDQFQLYGITARYPKKLFSQQPELTKVQNGVYDMHRGSDNIRLIILNEIPHEKHNVIQDFQRDYVKKYPLKFGQSLGYKTGVLICSLLRDQIYSSFNTFYVCPPL